MVDMKNLNELTYFLKILQDLKSTIHSIFFSWYGSIEQRILLSTRYDPTREYSSFTLFASTVDTICMSVYFIAQPGFAEGILKEKSEKISWNYMQVS